MADGLYRKKLPVAHKVVALTAGVSKVAAVDVSHQPGEAMYVKTTRQLTKKKFNAKYRKRKPSFPAVEVVEAEL